MYNPTKYPYKTLLKETINGSRKYSTPDGEKLPSVTTILDATKSEASKATLNAWKKRMGPSKAQAISTEASSRGTRVHKWLENYIKTGVMGEPGSNPYSKQSHQMATSIMTKGLSKCSEYWGTEVALYNSPFYAGTTDCVGIWENKPSIIDFKQTNKIKRREWITDYFLQLVFYGIAHNSMFNTNINTGIIMMCSADNQYQEFILQGDEWYSYETNMWNRLEQYYMQEQLI